MPFIAMVSSVGKNDKEEMYNYLGGVKNNQRSSELDVMFKNDKSTFVKVVQSLNIPLISVTSDVFEFFGIFKCCQIFIIIFIFNTFKYFFCK